MCSLISHLPEGPFFCDGAENSVRRLFIMESPDKQELVINGERSLNFPCMGTTGQVMSKHLVDLDASLGGLLSMNSSEVVDIAVIETFDFPLNSLLNVRLTRQESLWQKLKEIEDEYNKHEMNARCKQYERLRKYIERNRDYFPYQYTTRLGNCIANFPNLEEIVVCGFIAQSVFLFFFDLFCWPYNKRQKFTIAGKQLNLYFVNHPVNETRNPPEVWAYNSP